VSDYTRQLREFAQLNSAMGTLDSLPSSLARYWALDRDVTGELIQEQEIRAEQAPLTRGPTGRAVSRVEEEQAALSQRVTDLLCRENTGPTSKRQAVIQRRGDQAEQRGEAREARLEERFARLNPEFGVLPSRTDPQQHRFAQGRERALALGSRVHLAEAHENTGSPELAAWQVRERALRAGRLGRDQQPAERRAVERVRAGAER
jgi:hypothetical protein